MDFNKAFDRVWQLQCVCSTEIVRSMPLVVQRSLFFTLEELRYEEPATEAGRALAWPFFFFLVWEQFLSVEVFEEERKASKGQSSSLRWISIEESRKKKVIVSSSGVPEYTRTWVRLERNVGKYQNGTSHTRVSARHNWDARAPLWVSFSKGFWAKNVLSPSGFPY